jgi:hypothetical protein
MRTTARTRTVVAMGAGLAAAAVATMLASAASPKFLNDDPLQVEADTQDASGMKPAELRLFTDLAYNFIKGSDAINGVRAQNVNTVDEVPNSSWFTNRAGARPLTSSEVGTGPDTDNGPAPGTWTVRSSKSDGVTPGFTVSDSRGQRWFLKFDPRGFRGMTTGTDVAVSKLMWALGYHVPENHIAYVRPEQLVVGEDAAFTTAGGTRRHMRPADVEGLLARVDRERDGSYRVVASKALPGRPVGRIRFFGTRPDDPNDLVPHENRRELRGYRVFAAWLNHWDAKALNSLDTLVNVDGRSVVRHHLIDFGSALGSAGLEAGEYWEGEEYVLEPGKTLKQALTFGFSIPRWRTERFYENSAIGRFPENNTGFDPDAWKPRVPNRAFLHARDDDKFWAARKVAAMSTDLIRAALRAGQFGDAEAEEFLVRALVERRIAIARAYLPRINPISDPVLRDGQLTFVNAAVDMDVAVAPAGYRSVWSTFDNATGATGRIAESKAQTTSMPVPEELPRTEGAFIKIELSAVGASQPSWEQPVDAYFRLRDGQWRLVGFERLPER